MNESVKERTEMHHIPIFQNRIESQEEEKGERERREREDGGGWRKKEVMMWQLMCAATQSQCVGIWTLYIFDTSFCFVQSLAPLLLNEILCFIYQNKAKIEEILMVKISETEVHLTVV